MYLLRQKQRAWLWKHNPGAILENRFGATMFDDAWDYLNEGLDVVSVQQLVKQQQILVPSNGLHELVREAFINGVISELRHLGPQNPAYLNKYPAGGKYVRNRESKKKRDYGLAERIYGKTSIEED